MADYNEAVVAELTGKLSAYVKILPDHTESTEIDDRFHKAVEEMGHILAPNKFNELIIALSFNTPFILKMDPNEPEEEHDHHHDHEHHHGCGCEHHD